MNKNLKRTISVIMTVLMLAMTFSCVAFASEATTDHTGHSFEYRSEIAALGCKDGNKPGTYCKTCKVYIEGGEAIEAPHNYSTDSKDWIYSPSLATIKTEQACDGNTYTVTKICKDCNTGKTEKIIGHDFKVTGSDKGQCHLPYTLTKLCQLCGFIGEEQKEGGEHTWTDDDWTVVTAAKCFTDGTKKRICPTCKFEETGVIESPQDHTRVYKSYGKEPTCTADGHTAQWTCSMCGLEEKGVVLQSDKKHIDANEDNRCDVCNTFFNEQMPLGCSCPCHSEGILNTLFKILLFILQLFGQSETCQCGVVHSVF